MTIHFSFSSNNEGKEGMISVMKAKNYTAVKEIKSVFGEPSDLIFVQNKLKQENFADSLVCGGRKYENSARHRIQKYIVKINFLQALIILL